MKMRSITIELLEEDAEDLATFAAADGRTAEQYARDAVLDRLEDQQDLRDAKAAIQELRSGQGRTIPLEEIMKRHGVAD